MIKRTIRIYLLLVFTSKLSVAFSFTTYVMFLLSRGLTIFETSLVNMVFYATLFIFEIPTGALADVFGRKYSFVASCFLTALGLFFYYLSGSLWGFALAEATIAIGHTFASGAFQAWLVDKLHYHSFDGELKKVFAKEQVLNNLAVIIGGLLGAYVGKANLAWPWLVAAIGMTIVGVLAQVLMKEEYFVRQKISWVLGWQSLRQVVRDSWQAGVKNKAVRFLILLGTVQYFAVQAPNMQWQPYFVRNFHIANQHLGWIFSGVSVCMMFGSMLAPYFAHQLKQERKVLLWSQALIGLSLIFASFSKVFSTALIFFWLHEFGRGLFKPLKDQYLNDSIESAQLRATLISFESMSHHIGGFFGLLVGGLLAQVFGIQSAWLVSGLLLLVMSWLLAKNGRA